MTTFKTEWTMFSGMCCIILEGDQQGISLQVRGDPEVHPLTNTPTGWQRKLAFFSPDKQGLSLSDVRANLTAKNQISWRSDLVGLAGEIDLRGSGDGLAFRLVKANPAEMGQASDAQKALALPDLEAFRDLLWP